MKNSKEDPIPLIGEKDTTLLPATLEDICNYELEPFTPISEADDDTATTKSDLAQLNNHMAMADAMLPHVRSLDGLCKLSQNVCRLIETRRRVKKLKLGDSSNKETGKTFEILD